MKPETNQKPETQSSLVAKVQQKLPALVVLLIVLGGAGILILKFTNGSGAGSKIELKIPAFSATAQAGARAFANNCAQCHGNNAAGGRGGPPLIHAIYTPGHHGDVSFFMAMQRGVRQHHWRFGNMPPQPQVKPAEAKAIVRYIRELQAANGIGKAQR